jgi:hypothetical protein
VNAIPSFDRSLVESHVSLLHDLATGIDGILILAAFEENGPASVQRFKIGDVDGMIETIMAFEGNADRAISSFMHGMRSARGSGLTPEVTSYVRSGQAGAPSLSQVKEHIYSSARERGIAPDIAWLVLSHEGANKLVYNAPGGLPGSGWASGDSGHSAGPAQLYDKGLGPAFTHPSTTVA